MTKTQILYSSADDNSIDGARLSDDSIPNTKLESGIDGSKLLDDSVADSKLETGIDGSKLLDSSVSDDKLETGIDGAKLSDGSVPVGKLSSLTADDVTYTAQGTEAVARTVELKLNERVSVKDFGAVPGQDCTQAFQNAIDYCFNGNRRIELFIPSGTYTISEPLVIDMSLANQIRVFRICGEIMGSAIRPGACVVFTKENSVLFDVRIVSFPAENFVFENLTLSGASSLPSWKTSTAIKFTKQSSNYNRMNAIRNVACTGFDKFLNFTCPTGSPPDNNNYYGPIIVEHCHTYDNNTSINIDNCTLNLFKIRDSLFHGATNYGINASNSPLLVYLENTWFEGNQPAAIRNSAYVTEISMDGVGSETTGRTSGWGFLHAYDDGAGQKAFSINITNLKTFAFMPTELRLPRGGRISSSSPVTASGTLITIETPETVTPVISNNAEFNQTSTQTSFYVPLGSMSLDTKAGSRCFDSPTGNVGSSSAIHPDSSTLPDGLKGRLIGCGASGTHFTHTSGSFIAPEDGYVYGTASLGVSGLTGWDTGTQMTIDGTTRTIDNAYSLESVKGLFGVVIPIENGAALSQARLSTRGTHQWSAIGDVFFSSSYITASGLSSLPADPSKVSSISASSSKTFKTCGVSAQPYAVKVLLTFGKGSLGVYEALFYGVSTNGSKNVQTILNTADPSIVISTSDGNNVDLYNISVTNNNASAVEVFETITFLS
jgi:hypothetical protein